MSSKGVPSPIEHLGYHVGTDRKLAAWPESVEYFKKVAAASPRVLVEEAGKTTEGNPFIYATVSSPENLGRLKELRQVQMRLSKPAGLGDAQVARAVGEGK